MDRLDAMLLLVEAVETGTFSAASRKLGIPLPTLSRKVAELEEHLKTRLLVRSTRKLSLTEAGVEYLAACKKILDQVREAERAASGELSLPKGEIVLTAPVVFGRMHVLPVVSAFLIAFPQIKIRLLLTDRPANLFDDRIDMAVRVGALADSSMIAVRFGFVRRVVCGSPSFFAAHGKPKTPSDLGKLPCVTFDAMASGSSWSFAPQRLPKHKADQVVLVPCRLAVNTAEAALAAAVDGVGATQVLSYQLAPELQKGRLELVLTQYERAPIPVSLVHTARGPLPNKIRSFVNFAVPRLKQSLADLPAPLRAKEDRAR